MWTLDVDLFVSCSDVRNIDKFLGNGHFAPVMEVDMMGICMKLSGYSH